MMHGKKATAQRLFNQMLEKVKNSEMKRLASDTNASKSTDEGTVEHKRPPRVDPSKSSHRAMNGYFFWLVVMWVTPEWRCGQASSAD